MSGKGNTAQGSAGKAASPMTTDAADRVRRRRKPRLVMAVWTRAASQLVHRQPLPRIHRSGRPQTCYLRRCMSDSSPKF